MSHISMKSVSKSFNRSFIFQNVDLTVDAGQMIAIIGKSGVGKSTLLNIMAGLEPLSTGMYYLDNFKMDERNLNQLSRIRGEKIGYVSQFSPMIPKLTVFENICIPHFFKKKDEIKSYTERIKFLSNKLEIYHLLDKRIEKLSGGELQRVGIARSLDNKPEIIIADEPTGSLDDETAISILNYFQEMKSLGLVIILATHNNMVAEQCDSIYQLKSEGLFITQ